MFRRSSKKESKKNIFIELEKAKDESGVMSTSNTGEVSDIKHEMEGQLTVDVYEDGDDIVVESTVAGVKSDDLEINITSDSVSIRGKREREKIIEDENYYYQECFWGKFSRSVILPEEVDPEASKAIMAKNGILVIRMPKLKKKKAKKVSVKLDE